MEPEEPIEPVATGELGTRKRRTPEDDLPHESLDIGAKERPGKKQKRDDSQDDSNGRPDLEDSDQDGVEAPEKVTEPTNGAPKLSKNQLKKQRRLEAWEAGREDRKIKRKEKIQAKKERRREAFRSGNTEALQPSAGIRSGKGKQWHDGVQVPITVVLDCDFEDLMFDNELKSLGLQITRSYSDNRKAPYRTHLAISSWGGKLKERFDGILAKQYTSWKGFRFFEEDFVEVAEKAKGWMNQPEGGEIAGALKQEADLKEDNEEGEVVYLSSESDVTLERLKPNSTYIIGGLVDKNRHKGICYKRAKERGIKTAKLPIGEFLQMNSRKVLVTNHVLEIMLKWIEYDDWGKAFMEVLPKRKGGALKGEAGESTPGVDEEDHDHAEAVEEAAVPELSDHTTTEKRNEHDEANEKDEE